ncbi:unnamed protein product [Anisakis simplex]|uniref:Lysosomal acid phosphatase n=1 Tax=Anisakis simplex TaxID=6269 RepID=A0A0M3K6R5_ANISI|nr:unnamed protein product [Anisakis simplex]
MLHYPNRVPIIIFVACITQIFGQQSIDTLQSLQILFRHGERAPTKILIFPNEDPKILDKFPIEAGELTNDGIMQEYQLGQYIRTTYDKFLGKRYIPSQIRVLAGTDNRTVVSALSVLASLFPPEGDQVWSQLLKWQPIAVHSQPILDQFAIGAFDSCPNLMDTYQNTDVYKKIAADDTPFKQWLTQMTGIEVNDPIIYNQVLDCLISRTSLKDLPPPMWAQNDTILGMVSEKHIRLNAQITDLILAESGGWLYNLFVEGIENRINNLTNHKLLLYAAHDGNILTFGKFFAIPQLSTMPPFGSAIVLEHHLRNGDHVVELWFHSFQSNSRTQIAIPGCGDPCLFNDFKRMNRRFSSSSWTFLCKGDSELCEDYSIVLATMVGLTIMLGILTVLLVFVCCAYRNRLNKLLDPEQQSLLR